MSTTSLQAILTRLYEETGQLTPELLVETAADPGHPLHHRFEWDDAKAGHAWRLEQGAHLIRSVRIKRVVDNDAPSDLRAFTAVKGQDSHRSNYVPTEEAMADPFTAKLVLSQMQREWKTLHRRYKDHAEFAAMVQADLKGEAS